MTRWRPDGTRTRGLAVIGCLLLAMLFHFVWNAPWWEPGGAVGIERAAIYAAKGVPALVLVIVLVVAARLREVEWFASALVGEPSVPSEEVEELSTWQGRAGSSRAEADRHSTL